MTLTESLERGFSRRWKCAVTEDLYQHSFDNLPSEDVPEGNVLLCQNCGLRIQFRAGNIKEPRYVWYEIEAEDGTRFISRDSHRNAKAQLRRYLSFD